MGRDATYLAIWIRIFKYSDENVDEMKRLWLTTECHNKKDIVDFRFFFSNLLRISQIKHTYIY